MTDAEDACAVAKRLNAIRFRGAGDWHASYWPGYLAIASRDGDRDAGGMVEVADAKAFLDDMDAIEASAEPPPVPSRTVVGGPFWPAIPAYPRKTPAGTSYFKEAGVAMIASAAFDARTAHDFLDGFDGSLGFGACLGDDLSDSDPGLLVKFAGQLCYLSFGPGRTRNADADKYLGRIKSERHGSVLEHASFTFLFWGVDRALTHELVRHRVGFSFSQVSQRYCGGKTLRFVERPEIQPERLPGDAPELLREKVGIEHVRFERGVENAVGRYERAAAATAEMADAGHRALTADSATARRKRANQAARRTLPNETEAPIVVTGNGRSWRSFIDKRAGAAADAPIRELAVKVLRCLQVRSPLLFGDYEVKTEADGTDSATSPHFAV